MPARSYTTKQGQAWDQVARELWGPGGEDLTHRLLAANPDQRHLVTFPADLRLVVPEVDRPANRIPPAWKRRLP